MDFKVNVHLCWILMWITTLSYQDELEKRFRLKQLIEVIRRIAAVENTKLTLEIFELLMDACEKYGSLKMVLEVFEQIEDCKQKPNAAIMNYLLSGITKSNQSMEQLHKILKRVKERQQPHEIVQNTLQGRVQLEMERRNKKTN